MTPRAFVWRGGWTGLWFVDVADEWREIPELGLWARTKVRRRTRIFGTHAEAVAWAWEQVSETCPGQG